MRSPLTVPVQDWQAFLHELEDAFGAPIPASFQRGEVDVEALLQAATALAPDAGKQGQIVIAHELRYSLASLLGVAAASIVPQSKMAALVPGKTRREVMAQLQRESEWKLPRLGLPVWAQTLWGAGLLIGFILQFIYPLWGMLLFWGGMILSFQVEKAAWAFQYPTFGKWIARTVQLNWPSLELGAVDADRLRIAFAELLRTHWPDQFDPRSRFPHVQVHAPWEGLGPQWHVLNGDALRLSTEASDLPGDRIVMRECLAVGPVTLGANFFEARSRFIAASYAAPPAQYQQWVRAELERLKAIPAEADINLWFEDDLFCQVNLWFLIDQFMGQGRQAKIFRVMPILDADGDRWAGFGHHGQAALEAAFRARIALTVDDLQRGAALWQAYAQGDLARLQALGVTDAPQWRGLTTAVAAHIARQPDAAGLGRPERILLGIRREGIRDFEAVFKAFSAQAGEYGFGDLQVRALWDALPADAVE